MLKFIISRNPFAGTKFASGATFHAVGLQQDGVSGSTGLTAVPQLACSGGVETRPSAPSVVGDCVEIRPSVSRIVSGRVEIQPSASSFVGGSVDVRPSVVSGRVEIRPSVSSSRVEIRPSVSSVVSGHVEIRPSVSSGCVEIRPSVSSVVSGQVEIRPSVSSGRVEIRPCVVSGQVGSDNVESSLSLPGPSGIQKSLPWPKGVKSRKSITAVRFMPPIMSRGKKILQLSQAAQSRTSVSSSGNESQASSVFYDEISCEEDLPWPDGPVVESTKTTVIVNDGAEVYIFRICFCHFKTNNFRFLSFFMTCQFVLCLSYYI